MTVALCFEKFAMSLLLLFKFNNPSSQLSQIYTKATDDINELRTNITRYRRNRTIEQCLNDDVFEW